MTWDTVQSIAIGIGLAAACGFRVFLPLLGLSLGAATGHLHLSESFAWLGSTPATITLGTAAVAEIAAYYVPWLDHALDTLATPAALVAGVLASGAVAADLPPFVRWALAVIGGGGAAGLIQGASVLLRAKSTALTGGLANPVVATIEWLGAAGLAFLAILVPLFCLALVVGLVWWVARRAGRLLFGRRETAPGTVSSS
ncbi:MAG: DUF4126 domain-containing protein [Gemmatimonadales bacterium]